MSTLIGENNIGLADIYIPLNADSTLELEWLSDGQTVSDLTGYQVALVIRYDRYDDGAVVYEASIGNGITVDTVDGHSNITVSFPHSLTDNILNKAMVYTVWLIDESDKRIPILKGNIVADVTVKQNIG